MITKDVVWRITGCSKGLGRALAGAVLDAGYRVVVTARRSADVADLVAAQGGAAIAAAAMRFGAADVLVNNASYG